MASTSASNKSPSAKVNSTRFSLPRWMIFMCKLASRVLEKAPRRGGCGLFDDARSESEEAMPSNDSLSRQSNSTDELFLIRSFNSARSDFTNFSDRSFGLHSDFYQKACCDGSGASQSTATMDQHVGAI